MITTIVTYRLFCKCQYVFTSRGYIDIRHTYWYNFTNKEYERTAFGTSFYRTYHSRFEFLVITAPACSVRQGISRWVV